MSLTTVVNACPELTISQGSGDAEALPGLLEEVVVKRDKQQRAEDTLLLAF